MNRIDDEVLEEAGMLRDMFAEHADLAVQRRIAWSIDCARVDETMHWLAVETALNGVPL